MNLNNTGHNLNWLHDWCAVLLADGDTNIDIAAYIAGYMYISSSYQIPPIRFGCIIINRRRLIFMNVCKLDVMLQYS